MKLAGAKLCAFQYFTIRTRYRKLRQISPDRRRKFITALTYDATKQNMFEITFVTQYLC